MGDDRYECIRSALAATALAVGLSCGTGVGGGLAEEMGRCPRGVGHVDGPGAESTLASPGAWFELTEPLDVVLAESGPSTITAHVRFVGGDWPERAARLDGGSAVWLSSQTLASRIAEALEADGVQVWLRVDLDRQRPDAPQSDGISSVAIATDETSFGFIGTCAIHTTEWFNRLYGDRARAAIDDLVGSDADTTTRQLAIARASTTTPP